ncbi:MAG: DivIVA domain-containing protein [Desulfuromonadales bacterium]|nr:DivIVA domain-containing protein [Desulfuromonadales bacterium]NIR33810.1 DivIVA domain-containing protein [Desulfuromonadales bacterium]NIS41399.1 DivIVA domain-containing protein [Desulfuromonadales bacterium]
MRITPIDIQQRQFKSRMLGYDQGSVDQFLELVAEELARQHQQNQELQEELVRLRKTLEEMHQREKALQRTLMLAQQAADDVKSNAHKESDIIIADAKLQAERIVRDAEDRRIQLIGDIQELKRQKISFESSMRSLIESHMRMLDLEVVEVQGEERDSRLLEDPLPFDRQRKARRLAGDSDGE